jgi:hypothetical protein
MSDFTYKGEGTAFAPAGGGAADRHRLCPHRGRAIEVGGDAEVNVLVADQVMPKRETRPRGDRIELGISSSTQGLSNAST